MKTPKSILIFLTLFIFSVNSAVYAQISTKEIDALVEKAMKKFNVAGVAVAVVKDGKIIHKKGYGVKSIDSRQPVNEHTDFQIASNSKAFTTAALAILFDEGKAQSIMMKGVSPNIDFSFDFQDLDLQRIK